MALISPLASAVCNFVTDLVQFRRREVREEQQRRRNLTICVRFKLTSRFDEKEREKEHTRRRFIYSKPPSQQLFT